MEPRAHAPEPPHCGASSSGGEHGALVSSLTKWWEPQMIYLLLSFTTEEGGRQRSVIKTPSHGVQCIKQVGARGGSLFLVSADLLAPSGRHTAVCTATGRVRVPAARADSALLPARGAGDGNARRCPDHAEGTCGDNPGHCPRKSCLLPSDGLSGAQGNSGRDGRAPGGHLGQPPASCLHVIPKGVQDTELRPLLALHSELPTLWE